MGRGVSAGGGQSSLGYLFGGGDEPAPNPRKAPSQAPTTTAEPPAKSAPAAAADPVPAPAATKVEANKPPAATVPGSGSATNNYFRADGQNCGNFLTVSCNLMFIRIALIDKFTQVLIE